MSLATLQTAITTALIGGQLPAGYDPHALRLAGVLLVAKRRVEAAAWLPRTRQIMGPAWAPHFDEHAATFRPRGWIHSRDDALAFTARIAHDHRLPRAIRDLARFEAMQTRATLARGFLCIFAMPRYSSVQLHSVAGMHFWWRWSPRGRLHHRHLRWTDW